MQAGDALLIRGGSSACGLAALQLVAHMGAHVTSITRSPVHAGKIRMLGASIGASMDASIGAGMDGGIAVNIDAKTSAPAPETTLPQPSIQAMIDDGQLARTHPSCFDKALELIGAATLRDTLRCLRPGGVACFTGILGGWTLERFEPIEDIPSGRYLTSFHSDGVSREAIGELFAFIARQRISIAAPATFALRDIAEAHALMESNRAAGKIVVVND